MSMTEDQLLYQQRSARTYQALYDDTLRKVGMRAPQPVLGQAPNDYRRETLRMMKKTYLQNHSLYKINMRGLPDDILHGFEAQVLPAVVTEAYNPLNVPRGELRKVEELDEYGKLRTIRFVGQEHFVKAMGRPGRKVVSFNTSNGPVAASGMFLK